jgi:hypothetical protein
MHEMQRTLRQGGYLFLSFPYLSPLRKLKQHLGLYPSMTSGIPDTQGVLFYQFALDREKVRSDFEHIGFICRECISYDGIKGLKDEIDPLKPFLQSVYDGKRLGFMRHILDKALRSFTSHMALLIFQKDHA